MGIQVWIQSVDDLQKHRIHLQILCIVVSHEQLDQSIDFSINVADLSDAANFNVDILIDDAFVALEQGVDVEGLQFLDK